MTAQQQLAELMQRVVSSSKDGATLRGDALAFLRDHGPAIAELIAAAGRMRSIYTSAFDLVEGGLFVNKEHVPDFDDRFETLFAALCKLTQDA